MIEQKYLDEFDYLRDRTFLDVSFMAMQPKRTLALCRGYQDAFVRTCGRLAEDGVYAQSREDVKALLGRLINCRPDEILFLPNTTAGDNLAIAGLPLKAGDSVVLSSWDYPALTLGWFKRAVQGICVKNVPAENGCIRAEDLIAAADETTKVIAVSHVHNVSGYRTDLRTIGRFCAEHDILFCVDGIQAGGRVPVDVKDCCVDLYACGGFKGMLGVLGSAFCYCSPRAIERIRPAVWSDSNLDVPWDEIPQSVLSDLRYVDGIEKFEGGSHNNYGIAALGTSAQLLLEIGPDAVWEKITSTEAYFRERLAERNDPIALFGSQDPRHWSGIVSGTFDLSLLPRLEAVLEKREIYITTYERAGKGFFRVSLHYYNSEADIDRLLDAFDRVFMEQQEGGLSA